MEIKKVMFEQLENFEESFIELFREVYLNSYDIQLTDEFNRFIRNKAIAIIRKKQFEMLYLVLERNALIGYLLFDEITFLDKKIRKINQIVVHPRCRNNGVGQELIDKLVTDSKLEGINEIQLTVTTENTSAVRFYNKNGFDTFRYVMKKDI